ncbi:MAG: ABC transporter permease [Methylophaga sp.]|nr:ABC transporter permease [Methylophaga sp.]
MNFIGSIIHAFKRLPNTFSLAWVLAWRDFQGRYLGSKAGYFWAILSPLLYGVVFVILRDQLSKQGAEIDTGGVHPIIFAFFGIMLYQVWYEALTNQLNHLRSASAFLRNIKIDPEIFAVSAFILSLLDLGVRVILLIIFMVIFSVPVGPLFYLAPITLMAIVFTGNAIGYILALPASFFSDIGKFIQSISLGILLATPIFYSATNSTDSAFYWIQVFNPLATTLTLARGVVFGGELIFLNAALIWLLVLSVLSIFMLGVYRIACPLIIERL